MKRLAYSFHLCTVLIAVLYMFYLPCLKAETVIASASDGVDPTALSYIIEPSGLVAAPVTFTLRFTPSHGGQSLLALCGKGAWSGISNCRSSITAIQATGKDGRKLTLTETGDDNWLIEHEKETISISWQLRKTAHPPKAEPAGYLMPQANDKLFFAVGQTSLIYPKELSTGSPMDITLEWRGNWPGGWSTRSSHGKDDSLKLHMTLQQFRQAVFIAGPLRIIEKQVEGRALTFAMLGKWKFKDEALAEIALRIIKSERQFFRDFDFPKQLISVIQVAAGEAGGQAPFANGILLNQSITLVLSPDIELKKGSTSRTAILQLLSHENFHSWVGGKIPLGPGSEALAWFSEGFTNHMARKQLYRSGQFSIEDYRKNLNDTLAAYLKNRHRNAPNVRIGADFFHNEDIRALPYLRGDLLAHLIDGEIRRNGGQGIAEMMRSLLNRSRPGETLSNKKLFELIESFTSKTFRQKVEKIVMDGETVILEANILEPCMRIEKPAKDKSPSSFVRTDAPEKSCKERL